MAKRFTKPSTDWAALEKLVPPDQKGMFLGFKAKSDNYFRRVLASPEAPPKINWEEYQKIVPVPGLVDKFKQQYESFQIPYPADTLSASIDAQWSKIQEEVKAFKSEMQQEISNARKELSRIQALPRYEDMTMEMYCQMFPEDAIDPVNKPTFWPHNPEEQLGYISPEEKAMKESGGHH